MIKLTLFDGRNIWIDPTEVVIVEQAEGEGSILHFGFYTLSKIAVMEEAQDVVEAFGLILDDDDDDDDEFHFLKNRN